jgi:TPP-dependent pyruvate/acetoin dehydrogenase alpha subunit
VLTSVRPVPPSAEAIDVERGLELLRWMTLSRALEDELHRLHARGRLRGRLISGRGQEAIPVGATATLRAGDVVAPVHRDLGAHLVKGTSVLTVVRHYFGRVTGPSGGRDGDIHMGEWHRGVFPMVSHLPDSWPVIGGVALGFQLGGEDRVALAFCGDGATSTGAWHEAVNFAAVLSLPVVFVIEENGYAYSTPPERQYRAARLVDRAPGYGIPGVEVDGNDVGAVHAATADAVDRARCGGGPTLIEAHTFRIDGHAVHDGAEYVPAAQRAAWTDRDPIERQRELLRRAGVDQDALDDLRAACVAEVVAAVAQAEAEPEPSPADAVDRVYATVAP